MTNSLRPSWRSGRTSRCKLTHIPGQSDYRKRLATDFAAGTPADVTLINYRRYAAFAAKGVLEPLGPYLGAAARSIKRGDFYEEAMTPYDWKGTLTCLPQNLSSLVVYYNKNLFDAAGLQPPSDDWTWDDFVATAKALTKDTDGDGASDQFGIGTEASIFRLAPMIWQNGGDIVDDPANPKQLTLDTPEAQVGAAMVHRPAGEAQGHARCGERGRRGQRKPLPERPPRHVPQQPPRRSRLSRDHRFRLGRGALAAGQAAGRYSPCRCLLHGCRNQGQSRHLGLHRIRHVGGGPDAFSPSRAAPCRR